MILPRCMSYLKRAWGMNGSGRLGSEMSPGEKRQELLA